MSADEYRPSAFEFLLNFSNLALLAKFKAKPADGILTRHNTNAAALQAML